METWLDKPVSYKKTISSQHSSLHNTLMITCYLNTTFQWGFFSPKFSSGNIQDYLIYTRQYFPAYMLLFSVPMSGIKSVKEINVVAEGSAKTVLGQPNITGS